MKTALIFHNGRATWADVDDGAGALRVDGDVVAFEDAQWLPPVTPGASIYALGLNFADHNKELGFQAKQAKPLIFLKGHATLLGHDEVSPLPADANQMHPECELVAIIGKPARNVTREEALDYVGGYTIANDYAIREYLENYYRPNARVKNRDATTPIGPWVVDARDLPDPQALAMTTRVNGKVVQSGSTRDMILSVAGLVEYLSNILTLAPGDMILTGTPHGVHFVSDGDLVESEIESLGMLKNTIRRMP